MCWPRERNLSSACRAGLAVSGMRSQMALVTVFQLPSYQSGGCLLHISLACAIIKAFLFKHLSVRNSVHCVEWFESTIGLLT